MDILRTYLIKQKKAAIAFSGGTDSAYLLYAAVQAGCKVTAYYVKSVFQPEFELDDAKRMAAELGADLKIIHADVLSDDDIRKNGPKRCYYCKKYIFSLICQEAEQDGFDILFDGTNASDDANDRPGMQALHELNVLSPLRICHITKTEVRARSKAAGLFTWNKPAYACLATRILTDTEITEEALKVTEKCESEISNLGFSDFRIRNIRGTAKLQVTEEQIPLVFQKRTEINNILKPYYKSITLDLEGR